MAGRLRRYLPLLPLVGMPLCYGGFVAPNLFHGLIALSGLLFAFAAPKPAGDQAVPQNRQGAFGRAAAWPFPRRVRIPLFVLAAGLIAQLLLSPNRWETLQSLLWLGDAFILAAIFSAPEADRPPDRVAVACVVSVALIEVALLPAGLFHAARLSGTFVNPNHAAAFLVLGFWLAWRAGRAVLFGYRHLGAQIRTLVAGTLAAGVVLTFSAGAAASLALAALLFLLRKKIPPRLSVPALYGALLLAQLGYAFGVRTPDRHAALSANLPTKLNDEDRRAMVRSAAALWMERPWLGHGLGAYPERFASLADIETTYRVANYAHQDFLQLLAEAGLPLSLIALALIWLLFAALLRPARLESIGRHRLRQAVLWAGVTMLFHSLVDFPWHVPAVALSFVALCAASFPTAAPPSRAAGAVLLAASVAILTVAPLSALSRWSVRHRAPKLLEKTASLARGNPDPPLALARFHLQSLRDVAAPPAGASHALAAARHASAAARRAPFDADAREILGAALARSGDLPAAADQMEKAAGLDPKNAKRLARIGHWLVSRGFAGPGAAVARKLGRIAPMWRTACFDILSRVAPEPMLLASCLPPESPEGRLELAVYLDGRGNARAAFEEAYATLRSDLDDRQVPFYFAVAKKADLVEKARERVREVSAGRAFVPLERLAANLATEGKDYGGALLHVDRGARAAEDLSALWAEAREALRGAEQGVCPSFARGWIRRWPRAAHAYMADAVCAERGERYAHALASIQKVLEYDPTYDEAWSTAIRLWQLRDVPERGVETACKARTAQGAAHFLRICLEGLAAFNRCAELRKAWDDRAAFPLEEARWAELAAELGAKDAVIRCRGEKERPADPSGRIPSSPEGTP